MTGFWIQTGVLILCLLTVAVASLGAVLLWRNGFHRGYRRARELHPPLCPRCEYDLSGLPRCRCPECGLEFTLDQLWKSTCRPKADRRVAASLASPATAGESI